MVRPDWLVLDHEPTIVDREVEKFNLDHKEKKRDGSFKEEILEAKQLLCLLSNVHIFPVSLF